MRPAAPIITLLSDFGTADAYVAAMKGVILGIAPEARLVDVTHAVPPQDVFAGALALRAAAPWFPAGTVHLAVVDPGVGTAREPIVIETATARFVGPNNGLLTLAARPPWRVYVCEAPAFRLPDTSATFHGRDVFAPAAAFLAGGAPAAAFGRPLEEERCVRLRLPEPRREGPALVGEVIHVDGFGNLVTSIRAEHLGSAGAGSRIEAGGEVIMGLSRTYGEAAPGALVALVGSSELLEIAVRDGSAAARLGLGRGGVVRLTEEER
jgi:S-adenosylmethionine hydrolase